MSAFGVSAFGSGGTYPNEVTFFKLKQNELLPKGLQSLYTANSFIASNVAIPLTGNAASSGTWRTCLIKTPAGLHSFSSATNGATYVHYFLANGATTWVEKPKIGFGWGYTLNGVRLQNGLFFFNSIIENSNSTFVMDEVTGAITQLKDSPTRHHYTVSVLLDNGLVVKAGSGYGDTAVEAFDYPNNTWQTLPSPPIYCSALCALPGNVLFAVDPASKRSFTLTYGDLAWAEVGGASVPAGWLGMAYESKSIVCMSSDNVIRLCDPKTFTWSVAAEPRMGTGTGANGSIVGGGDGFVYLGFGETATPTAQSFKVNSDSYFIVAAAKA